MDNTEKMINTEPRDVAAEHGAAPPLITHKFRNNERAIVAFVVVLVIAAAITAFMLNQAPPAKLKKASMPVTVATAELKSLPIEIRNIGNVAPFSVVNIIPQVSGQLTKVCFKQGDFVKKGDLLFEIDPRLYQAAVEQAKGNLAKDVGAEKTAEANMVRDNANIGQLQANYSKDQASHTFAKAELVRYDSLVAQGAVSHEQSDQMSTNAATAFATLRADLKQIENARAVVSADKAGIEQAKGTIAADQAALHTAQIQLDWTEIRSPIDGRTGALSVYQGNVVAANQTTAIVGISQIDPIYVNFGVPEQYLEDLRRSALAQQLRVQAMIEGAKTDSIDGSVSFLDNTVNTTTGSIMIRATFENAAKRLWPGQFVDVTVTLPGDGNSVAIPTRAVQPSQQGQSVYVVEAGNKVKFVPITVKRTYGEYTVVGKGLSAGDVVVTDGQLQLSPGALVTIKTRPASEDKKAQPAS